MPSRQSFRKGLVSSGTLVPLGLALPFLMDVVLARKLGPDEYGRFSYVFTASTLIALLASAGIPAATMRFLAQYVDAGQWALARGVLKWSFRKIIIAALATSLIVAIGTIAFLRVGSMREEGLFVALLVTPMVLWVWQRFASLGFHRVNVALIPRDVALPLLIVFLAFHLKLNTAASLLWIYALSLLVIEVIAIAILLRRSPPEFRKTPPAYSGKLWMATALPMALNSVMQLGMNRWDILILGWFGNAHAVGIYYAATRLALMATPISRVVITFTGPLIAAASNNNRQTELAYVLRHSLRITLGLGLPFCALLLLAPYSLSALAYGEPYRAAGSSLLILAIGQLVSLFSIPSSTLLWMGGGERQQAAIALVGTLLSVVLCFALIPRWGAEGAAVATTSSLITTSLLYIYYGRRLMRRMPPVPAAPKPSTGGAHGEFGG